MNELETPMLITGTVHDLGGGLMIRRLLPYRKRHMVGPFIFLDHMGPVTFSPDSVSDIRPHPHIGLSTLTYLLQGRMVHRDSLGNVQVIEPGEVNWMTAGHAIAHSERAHTDDYGKPVRMEGLQFWLALPDDREDQEPAFAHYKKSSLPILSGPGFKATLIAGTAMGATSPVATSSPTVFVEFHVDSDSMIPFTPEQSEFEIAIYVLKGSARSQNTTIESGQIAILTPAITHQLEAQAGTHLIVIGGEAFKTQRFIYWNFVSSSREKIDAAKKAWKEEKFPLIPGDDQERIPLGD